MKEIARFNYRGTTYRLVVNDDGDISNQVMNDETLDFEPLTPDELVRQFTAVDNVYFLMAMAEAGELGADDGTQPQHFMAILGRPEAARYGFSVDNVDRSSLN